MCAADPKDHFDQFKSLPFPIEPSFFETTSKRSIDRSIPHLVFIYFLIDHWVPSPEPRAQTKENKIESLMNGYVLRQIVSKWKGNELQDCIHCASNIKSLLIWPIDSYQVVPIHSRWCATRLMKWHKILRDLILYIFYGLTTNRLAWVGHLTGGHQRRWAKRCKCFPRIR